MLHIEQTKLCKRLKKLRELLRRRLQSDGVAPLLTHGDHEIHLVRVAAEGIMPRRPSHQMRGEDVLNTRGGMR
jgi:hypothetical protein